MFHLDLWEGRGGTMKVSIHGPCPVGVKATILLLCYRHVEGEISCTCMPYRICISAAICGTLKVLHCWRLHTTKQRTALLHNDAPCMESPSKATVCAFRAIADHSHSLGSTLSSGATCQSSQTRRQLAGHLQGLLMTPHALKRASRRLPP